MLERRTTSEVPKTPEKAENMAYFAALHPRLLVGGESLNPDKRNLSPITKDHLGNFPQRDYSVFQYVSARERMTFWSQRQDLNYTAKYAAWEQNTTTTFANSKNFFTNTSKGKSWAELYSKLNIDSKNFAKEAASAIYQRYFTGEQNKVGLRQFISDILHVHTVDGKLDSNSLEKNLPAISWLANIFGKGSSEVIAQLISAEGKLINNPNALVKEANEKKTNSSTIRVNELNPDEDRILRFLWSSLDQREIAKPTEPEPNPTTPSTEVIKFKYERPGDPRIFPGEINTQVLLNPQKIARSLKILYPNRYGNIQDQELANQVDFEQKAFKEWRQQTDLSNEYLREILIQNLNHYGDFLKKKYKIQLPSIGYIQIVPLSGKTAEAFAQHPGRLAFTHPSVPAIFLDLDVIYDEASKIGRREHKQSTGQELLSEMPRGKIRSLILRLLHEIQPHEYTHLIGDVAFWDVYRKTPTADEKINTLPGKVGLAIIKPDIRLVNGNFVPILQERGKELMEAVTVELTEKWAKSFNARLDIDAYPGERKILDAIIRLLSKEQKISKDEAFNKIVRGYFTPNGFRELVKDLSGREKAANRINYKRPHFMQIVYALSRAANLVSGKTNTPPDYSLTVAYIKNSNNLVNLTEEQKLQISDIIRYSKKVDSEVQLSNKAIKYLVSALKLDPSLK